MMFSVGYEFLTINDVFKDLKESSWSFSNNIFINRDLTNYFIGQKNILEAKTDIFNVMTVIDNNEANYFLMTSYNVDQVIDYLHGKDNIKHTIIQSVHGDIIFNSEDEYCHIPGNHQNIMQQIALVNGDSDLLATNHSWLLDGSEEVKKNKLKLLTNIVTSCHPAKQWKMQNLLSFLLIVVSLSAIAGNIH